MESIRFISRNTIFAERDLNNQPQLKIPLTPWDLKLIPAGTIQKGLLFHKPTSPKCFIDHLKTSLSRTLHYFPPLAGRLATTHHEEDNTISHYFDCNNSGAEFIHAIADGVSITDIIDSFYVPDEIVYSFFPVNETSTTTSNPLLAVQVTELVDGVFIACSIYHSVVDGSSFWHFLNCWSEISRGSDSLSKPPVINREFLSFMNFPIRLPSLTVNQISNVGSTSTPQPGLKQRVFHFSRENISKLKAKANAEIGETNKISSLQALSSHIWRSIVRNRKYKYNTEVKYRLPIGIRARLKNPALTQQYFGNAIWGGPVVMKAGEVVERGLGRVALELNNWVVMNTEEKLVDYLESWEQNPVISLLANDAGERNTVFTASSPRFDVYGNDFGWGKPIAARSGPDMKFDGKLTLYGGVEEGSVDVEACLKVETLQGMELDADFMDAFTNKSSG